MRRGFTLLELLTVMAIMAIVSSIAVMGYFGAMRGSGARSAADHMTQSISLARQTAIMQGKKVMVVFGQDATNGWYQLCQAQGVVSYLSGATYIGDEYADWSDLTNARNMVVYDLSTVPVNYGVAINVLTQYMSPPAVAVPMWLWMMQFNPSSNPSPFTAVGQTYGWPIYPKTSLAKGLQFGNGVPPSPGDAPPPILFNPDGSSQSAHTIDVFESINLGRAAVRITVEAGSGFVTANLNP
jgi:prepilin-type N-terminal cleavage/methylation domain-containing protein